MRKPEEYIGRLVANKEPLSRATIIGIVVAIDKEVGHHLRRERLKERYQKDFQEHGIIHGGNNVFVKEENGQPELWAWTRPCLYKFIVAPLKKIEAAVDDRYGARGKKIQDMHNTDDRFVCYFGCGHLAHPGESCGDFAVRMMKKFPGF